MTKLLWLLGGTGLALAVFAILHEPDYVGAPAGGVEGAAGKVVAWGTKQRAAGAGGQLVGKVEEFAGKLTGSSDTASQGTLDQATSAVRNAAGQAAQALGETIHDLNKA